MRDERGGLALAVAGVVQSLEIDATEALGAWDAEPHPAPRGGYWGLLLPPGCPRRALLLGLGGGTVAQLLARRCPAIELVGVERDEKVVAIARAEFGLGHLPHMRVELAEALAWAEEHASAQAGTFDLICLDLFEGGRLTLGALATPFLRALATMLTPGGTLTANLIVTARTPDQLTRLRHVFHIERELRHHGNLIVHLRPLSTDGSRKR
jgi:spermidine synthase